MEFEEFTLAASTTTLPVESTVHEYADAIEYRLDRSPDGLDALAAVDGALPVLVTNRVETEGGDTPATPARIETLCRAVESDVVEAVDIELDAVQSGDGQRVLEAADDHGVATVVSVHDFERTPAPERLRELLRAAGTHGDVAKLAVTAETPADVLDLLTVTHEATQDGETVATMAMGAVGRHSRVVTPLYGSRLGYAPAATEDATAPGQYNLQTFRRLYEALAQS